MKNVDDLYPLTPTQSGMLFQCLRDDDPELYFEQVRGNLAGDLDLGKLHRSFQRVTDRHPALRTAILWEGLDKPIQAVRTAVEVPFEVVERPGATDVDLDELAAQRRQTGFDLAKAPLQRIAIVECGGDRQHLIWEFHHIVCDGWSAAMVLDEVLSAYNDEGQSRLPPATPFRNFLSWHARQDSEATGAYWKDLLHGFTEPTPILLPSTSSERSFASGLHTTLIEGSELDTLIQFARRNRVTLNTLVQAAWSMVQSRYGGSDDVVFGVTNSGRPADLDDVEHIVGMFLTTLPMRVDTDPSRLTSQWLQSIQRQQLESLEHSTASLADLHRQVGIPTGGDLFDTVLVFENYPRPDERPEGSLTLGDKTVFEQTNYPLTLLVGIEDGVLKLVANFNRNRFDPDAIVRLMDQFRHALTGLASDPQSTIGEQRFLTDEDFGQFDRWQGSTLHFDRSATIASRLLDQADRTPDAVALIDGDRTVTFGELVARARGVAAELRSRGVGPETPVGVAIPRSIEMVVAVVGIVLSGGAYVPLDPRYPPHRLALMLEVSGTSVVLTVPGARDNLQEACRTAHNMQDTSDVQLLDPNTIDPVVDGSETEDLPITPASTFVVTFTSGSSGVPKGVRLHHCGILGRLEWQWHAYPLEPGEVLPQKTTLGFVDHLWELWGALLHGNPVLLIDDDTVTDPDALIATLAAHAVRRVSLVPSLLDLLLEHVPDLGERLPRLTMWTCSGEALAAVTSDRFDELLPGRTLINLYGMSEVSADATAAEVVPGQTSCPIGRPITNTGVRVLDRHDRQVPVGVPGEIHLSGVGVSPGYWNRPDLTDERFVPNPFAGDDPDHARLYRSGDIARWRGDGILDYLGRSDHQLKIRGVRVELGEVETALASHPAVDRAVVDGREMANSTTLIAYVTALARPLDSIEVLEHARSLLPEVMVPSHVIAMDHFPLLPNGKVDRRALPGPKPPAAAVPVDDLTDAEAAMLALWRTVMEQPSLGPDDDFFDSGGHSMLAMRLVSRIRTDLGIKVGLAQLLRTGTPRSLAASGSVPAHESVSGEATMQHRFLVPIREPEPDLRNIFMIHGAGGDILTFQPTGRYLAGRYNVWGIQAAGVDGESPVHDTQAEVVRDYLAEIRQVQPSGPYLLAGFSTGGVIGVELVKRLQADGQTVEALILIDAFHPSMQPRTIPLSEHLAALVRTGPSYGFSKLRQRVERRRLNKAIERSTSDPSSAGPVPLEVRKWEVTGHIIDLWADYAVSEMDVPVIMMSSEEVFDIWEGVIDDARGWGSVASDLRIVKVPGDHMNLLEEPHARVFAERLADALES